MSTIIYAKICPMCDRQTERIILRQVINIANDNFKIIESTIEHKDPNGANHAHVMAMRPYDE